MTFPEFLSARAAEAYPEERTQGHDGITAQMAAIVAPMLPKGGTVLDVGCGKGPALEWFSKAGFDVTGTSVCGDDIRDCEALGFHEVYPCDMHEVAEQFDGESFDCVWARHVLEHSVIPFFALHEFARVLKPGGILYAEMPDPQTPCKHWSNPNHYSVFTCEMWQSLISRAGFEILEIREIKLETGAGPDLYHSFIAKKK